MRLTARLVLLSLAASSAACVDTRPPKITKINDGPISLSPRTGQLNDFVGVIDAKTAEDIERRLKDYRRTSGTDVVIVIVPSTDGHLLEDHASEIAKQWRLDPTSERDARVLLYIATDDQQMRVQVTKPLWEVLPNDELDRFQAELQHYFEAGNFSEGISHFVDEIIAKLSSRREAFVK